MEQERKRIEKPTGFDRKSGGACGLFVWLGACERVGP